MGIFQKNDGKGIERWFIELPDANKGVLVFKWPDQQIRNGSKITVDVEYSAVFISRGIVQAVLPPGQHVVEAGGASRLFGWVADHLTNDGSVDAELFFVNTKAQVSTKFGGPIDTIKDPLSELVVSVRVFGQCAWQIGDPSLFVTRLAGSDDTDPFLETEDWLTSQVLAAVREVSASSLSATGVLGLGAAQQELEDEALPRANTALAPYGVEVLGFGQLFLNISDEDAAQVKKLSATKAYSDLAGGFEQYARGSALLNIGSSADGASGDGTGGVVALMLLKSLAESSLGQAQAPTAVASSAVPSSPACYSCKEPSGTGKFCPSCGTGLTCAECEARLSGPFCSSCGTAVK